MYPVIKHIISPTRYQSRDAAEMVTASGKVTFNRVKYPVMTPSRMPIPPGANTNKIPMVPAKGKQKNVEKCREEDVRLRAKRKKPHPHSNQTPRNQGISDTDLENPISGRLYSFFNILLVMFNAVW